MSEEWSYSDEELKRYFNDPSSRRQSDAVEHSNDFYRDPNAAPPPPPRRGIRGFFMRTFGSKKKADAAFALSVITGLGLLGFMAIVVFLVSLGEDELPSLQQLENPDLQLATVAYTADGKELARYAYQNRSSVAYADISPNVINALVATEDHRFHNHWGIDLFRFFVSAAKTVMGDVQGGSTITMQLARNLYNKEIGKRQTISRKLKEMLTAVQLERRYTKREIIEMYLNTVEFGNNAFGIEAAARTFFSVSSTELDTLQSATLVGMLKGITMYNPIRNPNLSRQRRNVVLGQMVKNNYLSREYLEANLETPIETEYSSSEITAGFAPYFAEHVRQWLGEWGKESGHDIYSQGLIVHTTLDTRMQEIASEVVERQMNGLQQVVDYEWSRKRFAGFPYNQGMAAYTDLEEFEPFSEYWRLKADTLQLYIQETEAFRVLRNEIGGDAAIDSLMKDEEFVAQFKADKTRLEAGMISIDPRSGYVKAWVGGRNLKDDWYDHVAKARRQPGSTFKPFAYIAAIDNGYSPDYMLADSSIYWEDDMGNEWQAKNSGEEGSGLMLTLREGLKQSKNTITARLVLKIGAPTLAFYARRMGIKSPLIEVPSLALGTSNVTLQELTTAYSTLANSGIKHEPTVITRIEDRLGNVLYEARPRPEEALNEQTALKGIDMLRDVIQAGGTGIRVRTQYSLYEYDLAGKTGTTQNSADCWFMLMHPELVTGAWVGFNDQRVTFRTDWWGQGAHSALHLVGDFTRKIADEEKLSKVSFPLPIDYSAPNIDIEGNQGNQGGKVNW